MVYLPTFTIKKKHQPNVLPVPWILWDTHLGWSHTFEAYGSLPKTSQLFSRLFLDGWEVGFPRDQRPIDLEFLKKKVLFLLTNTTSTHGVDTYITMNHSPFWFTPGAKWFPKVSIHHPLGFNWHPFEGLMILTPEKLRPIFGVFSGVVEPWSHFPCGDSELPSGS